ncbi:MAG: ZIP family metal transporter [Flavobacteriales bacterium]|nr:ZIP family metal transporter [Flavobacteriales bacterium]
MGLTLTILVLILSVPVGGMLVAFVDKKDNDQIIKLMLAFSGGFLLSLAFIHFIPELYEHSTVKIGIYILIGFLVQLLLEFFSGGIEHGHVHSVKGAKIPIALVIALSLHAFLEGIPLGTQLAGAEIATTHHHEGGSGLLMGILLHRIPVAIALTTVLFASKISREKVWFTLGIFALTTPIGLLIGWNSVGVFDFDFNIILAIVVGMFLHISTTIIFETSENHKFNFIKLLAIIGGAGLAFLIH